MPARHALGIRRGLRSPVTGLPPLPAPASSRVSRPRRDLRPLLPHGRRRALRQSSGRGPSEPEAVAGPPAIGRSRALRARSRWRALRATGWRRDLPVGSWSPASGAASSRSRSRAIRGIRSFPALPQVAIHTGPQPDASVHDIVGAFGPCLAPGPPGPAACRGPSRPAASRGRSRER
jgi:hypothetical protein